ncbi:MAG: hypothetical protein ABR595_06710 [Psychroflexus sp.]
MKPLLPLILRFLIYALTMLGIVLVIRHDFADALVDEYSAIEIFQETLLALSIIVLIFLTFNYSGYKLFYKVLSGVLAVHFIREFDFWLNERLFDNAWQVFAGIVVIFTSYFIFKNFKKLVSELVAISKTYSFAIFFIGFIILHTFSRLFGSKKIWNWMLEPIYNEYVITVNGEKSISLAEYVFPMKTGAQESVELLAYTIMFIGVIEMLIFTIKSSRK